MAQARKPGNWWQLYVKVPNDGLIFGKMSEWVLLEHKVLELDGIQVFPQNRGTHRELQVYKIGLIRSKAYWPMALPESTS
jgi:hypothetical protein